MQTRSITSLITKAQGGDISAFTLLVRRHQDMAFAYAYSILGDFHSAEDAAQEAFLCVHAGLHTLRAPEAFPGWLRGIVRHQCHRLLRHQPAPCVPWEHVAESPALEPGPEEQWERRETRVQVLAAVRALPPAQREVTTLYYIQDHPISQIAAFLEVPETTVKKPSAPGTHHTQTEDVTDGPRVDNQRNTARARASSRVRAEGRTDRSSARAARGGRV